MKKVLIILVLSSFHITAKSQELKTKVIKFERGSGWTGAAEIGFKDVLYGSGENHNFAHVVKSGAGYFTFHTNYGGGVYERMRLLSNGSLGIGTTSTGTHKLAVEGSIGAREITVEPTGWSDFVFEKDYHLRTLAEVEQHINENGHLPEIPTEAEVTQNGSNLGEMNAKLLQKIEELTLYLIDLNKRVNKLEYENSELKESNQELNETANGLENK